MNIVVIGRGGHSKVLRDLILSEGKHRIVGYLDDQFENLTKKDHIWFGPISSVNKMISCSHDIRFVISVGNNETRNRIFQRLKIPNEYYMILIHPTAVVSPSARIGFGTVIMAHSVIQADSQIGDQSIINTHSIVEHDCHIDDFVHVSPGATLTGSVKLEEGVHIGAGATVIPNVKIGRWSVIGAGATVIGDLPTHCTAVGVPAQVIKNYQQAWDRFIHRPDSNIQRLTSNP